MTMDQDLVPPGPDRNMDEAEAELAEQVYQAVQAASNFSERSQQSADFRIGISDLGFCSEKVRRMLAGIPEPVTDKTAAFIGTALGDHIEQAYCAVHPNAIRQAEVSSLCKVTAAPTPWSGTRTSSTHPVWSSTSRPPVACPS